MAFHTLKVLPYSVPTRMPDRTLAASNALRLESIEG